MSEKFYLYKFEEGSSVSYGRDFTVFITTKGIITPENIEDFVIAANGQYYEQAEIILIDEEFESLENGRHYSIVQCCGEIDSNELKILERLKIISKRLDDKF